MPSTVSHRRRRHTSAAAAAGRCRAAAAATIAATVAAHIKHKQRGLRRGLEALVETGPGHSVRPSWQDGQELLDHAARISDALRDVEMQLLRLGVDPERPPK